MSATKGRKLQPARSPSPLALHEAIVDNVALMLWTATPDGAIDYVNRHLFEYAGDAAQQLAKSGWRPLVHPQDRPYCLTRWMRSLKTGEPYEVQYRLRRADGEYRWHLCTARPVKDSAGHVRKWYGTCTEIEEQLRAAQVLARRAREPAHAEIEQRLRNIMTLWSDFYWETDPQHRFTVLETGGRFETVMFVSTRLGKTRWETPSILPDAEGWRAHREALAARRAFRDFQTARVGDDGVVHHYSVDGEPVFDDNGGFQGYRGVGREITARKLAEQKLRDNGQRFVALLDNMPGIAWIKDSKLRYAWTSASYERILGKSLQSLLGRDDFEVWPAATAHHFRANDEKVLRANGVVQDLVDMRLPDGTSVRWLAVKFPMPDESGALGVAGISFDITERVGSGAFAGLENAALARLSGREMQVLRLLVDGGTSAEIGAQLALSPKSVDTYRSRLMAKLGIEDLPSLVKFALRNGLTGER